MAVDGCGICGTDPLLIGGALPDRSNPVIPGMRLLERSQPLEQT